jgi:hypothetical protein
MSLLSEPCHSQVLNPTPLPCPPAQSILPKQRWLESLLLAAMAFYGMSGGISRCEANNE